MHNVVTWMWIATFQLRTASVHQAIGSTGYTVPFVAQWSAVIDGFRSSLFCEEIFPSAVCEEVVPSVVLCHTSLLLLCFVTVRPR